MNGSLARNQQFLDVRRQSSTLLRFKVCLATGRRIFFRPCVWGENGSSCDDMLELKSWSHGGEGVYRVYMFDYA
jgi:hypothetical protein